MSNFLGKYIDDYECIFFVKEYNNIKVYEAYNKNFKRDCYLKVINKRHSILGDNFLKAQIKREEEITSLCKSEYTINLYRKLDTEEHIIFEFEYFEEEMLEYIYKSGGLEMNLNFFKYIV